MVKTNPEYMNGDELSLKQYFIILFAKQRLLFTNRLIWWKKTTKFWSFPLFLLDSVLFILLLYKEWSMLYLFLPFLVGFPLIWMRSYYISFITPSRIKKTLLEFIANYVTDLIHVRRLCLTNYTFRWRDMEFEVAYSLVPTLNSKGKVVRRQDCYVLCLHFIPDPAHTTEIIDKNGNLLDSFLEQWDAYCQGKESCKYLRIESGSIYAFIRVSDVNYQSLALNIMEQIEYLIKRFNLNPLSMSDYMAAEIRNWIRINNQEAPKDIKVINIGAFVGSDGYYLIMSGSRIYDPIDLRRGCQMDFSPIQRTLWIPMLTVANSDLDEFEDLVKDIIMKKVPVMAEDEHSIFYNRAVTLVLNNGRCIKVRDEQ